MYPYKMEFICSYTALLDPKFEVIGETPEGIRFNLLVTGGEVRGPKIKGKVRPVGADWFTIRKDGVGLLDVRTTIETDDGALIYNSYQGVAELGGDGYQRFLDRSLPSRTPLRAASRMITSHPDYLWLNRLLCINIGEGDMSVPNASYDVYSLQ